MFSKSNYDFLAMGDMVIDAFIKLREASINCDENKKNCMLSMRYADKIPYENAYVIPAVGNSANATVAASRLGLKSALYSNIGDDTNGADCIKTLKKEKVGIKFITVNKNQKTNYHYVLWFGNDRTILIKHEKYDYKLKNIGSPRWIYLSSFGENALPFHKDLEKYLNDHPKIKLAFQPGTFQIKFGRETLSGIYKRTEVFTSNKEEAQRILETGEEDIKKLLSGIANLGPKIVVITDGPKGAFSYDGKEFLSMRLYPDPAPPLERTGAGDAFSATFVTALVLGKNLREALKWAPINPMSVVQYIGAREGLLKKQELENYLKKAPEDYEPKIL